jgi:hypothetical protein
MSQAQATTTTTNFVAPDQQQTELTTISAPIADAGLAAPTPSHLTPIQRHYIVTFTGSLDSLSKDGANATWRPTDNSIFQSTTRYAPGDVERSPVRAGNLDQVVLLNAKLKRIDSSFPCAVGISLSHCKGNFYTGDGDRFSYLAGAMEQTHHMEQVIATQSPLCRSEFLKQYPGCNADTVSSEGVVRFPGENFCYINKDHPVIEMMQENQDILQIDLTNASLVDDRFYKISETVADRCLSELKTELNEHLPIMSLKNFSCSIRRPFNVAWNDTEEVCENVDNRATQRRLMKTKRRLTAILQLTYAYC